MKAQFLDLHAAADFIGPGAIEINRYQTEITDIVRRRGIFGKRMKQVPATGHPSRFFEETAIASPSAANGFVDPRNIAATAVSPTRLERSVPLKALVSQISYNLFDLEVGAQQSQFAFLQAKDLADAVDGVMRTHDVALWNGNDTSLSAPSTSQYYGAAGQIASGGNVLNLGVSDPIVDNLKSTIAAMVANSSYEVLPTAIYANPVLLDLIDREMKTEFNVVLNSVEITAGYKVKALSTQAGEIPLIPDWSLQLHGHAWIGYGAVAGVHRDRRPDRVPLADRSEPARIPARAGRIAGGATGGREVRCRGRQGRFLRALQSERNPVIPWTVDGGQWTGISVHCSPLSCTARIE